MRKYTDKIWDRWASIPNGFWVSDINNGVGELYYPGSDIGIDKPVASICVAGKPEETKKLTIALREAPDDIYSLLIEVERARTAERYLIDIMMSIKAGCESWRSKFDDYLLEREDRGEDP